MSILHLVRTSAFNTSELSQCLAILSKNDEIVLMDDGSYNANHSLLTKAENRENNAEVYVIESHATARAISVPSSIKLISMETLVQMTLANEKVITWQ